MSTKPSFLFPTTVPDPCQKMNSFVAALYGVLLASGDAVPIPRKLSISRLACMLRDEIQAAERESPLTAAQQDADFQQFKAKLIKRPGRRKKVKAD